MNKIKSIGIIGSGKMGTDIFFYLLQFNFSLTWICRSKEKKEYLENKVIKKIKRLIKSELIDGDKNNLIEKITISDDLGVLKNCDLIIESVIEDLGIKKDIFMKLDGICNNKTIFSSNSSSIIPSKIFNDLQLDRKYFNIHFFYPIKLTNIVEIIKPDNFDLSILDNAKQFLNKINKKYIILDEKNGFILNKIFLIIQAESFNIQKEYNISYENIDDTIINILPNGIFKFIDNVGINIIKSSVNEYIEYYKDKSFFKNMIEVLKNNKNLYSYSFDNQTLSEKVKNTIKDRILFLLINIFYLNIENNICDSKNLDSALTEYLNLDLGLTGLSKKIGKNQIYIELNNLYNKYKFEYYKPSRLLKYSQ